MRRNGSRGGTAAWLATAVGTAAAFAPATAAADLQWSGLADFVVRNVTEEDATNRNFRPTSNLDTFRTRFFVDAVVADDVQLFTQFLISGYADVFVYGAYLRWEDLGGAPVSAHLGLIPTTVGTWAARTYSDKNPLVGVPLAYNHHSSLEPRDSAQPTVDALLAQRADRTTRGLPVLYDNCWNTGVEVYGEVGAFDWSVGLLNGSNTLPSRPQEDKIPQGTARLAWYGGPELQIGANGWVGPYLPADAQVTWEPGKDRDDYLSGGYGYDLYASLRYLEIHSELYRAFWEHPELPTLYALSGYLEGKYKLRPRWYAAARFGFFEPEKEPDSSGTERHWDYPVHRAEYGVGFKARPRVTVKAVVQHNRFDGNGSLDEDHYLLQLSAGF